MPGSLVRIVLDRLSSVHRTFGYGSGSKPLKFFGTLQGEAPNLDFGGVTDVDMEDLDVEYLVQDILRDVAANYNRVTRLVIQNGVGTFAILYDNDPEQAHACARIMARTFLADHSGGIYHLRAICMLTEREQVARQALGYVEGDVSCSWQGDPVVMEWLPPLTQLIRCPM